jgi:serine/threonine protein kinase
VLISDLGDAMLADFGLATRLEKLPGATATPVNIRTAGSFHFLAPELLLGAYDEEALLAGSIKTRESDVYAFGMLILEVPIFFSEASHCDSLECGAGVHRGAPMGKDAPAASLCRSDARWQTPETGRHCCCPRPKSLFLASSGTMPRVRPDSSTRHG